MRRPLALVLSLVCGTSMAQSSTAPAPAQDTPPPKPRPPLKLNLDDAEPARPRVTFDRREEEKKDDKKKGAAANLPGLGGPASNTWERPASSVFPQSVGTEPPK